MGLSYLAGRFIVRPEQINASFDLAAFNDQNPDFYVPPHPLLYLVYFRPFMFFAVALANLVLPSHVAHVAQLLLLAFSVLIQPLISFFFLETVLQRGVFAVVAIVWKVFDWYSILDLLARAHVLFTTHNVYYWILNYFHFGLLGSWPILRPDMFLEYQDYYCFAWSC